MKNAKVLLALAAMVALVAGAATPGASAKRLDEAEIFIEVNATDGDAGIQVFLDSEGWKRMKIFDPDGKKVLDIRAKANGNIGMQGLTELFFESAEPSFDDQPFEEFLALFPEGIYRFRGTTTEGDKLNGKARLTHRIPDQPVQVSPVDGDGVDPDDAVFMWDPVADPPGSEIVNYQVIVECEEPEFRVLDVFVEPDVNTLSVPPEFLEGGEECKWEVLAIEESLNQTIAESEFEVD